MPMSEQVLSIERLPVLFAPPFDCINDNAACPACKRRRGSHGVSGSITDFAVLADHAGKRVGVSLRVLGADYLAVTRQWWREKGLSADQCDHRAADLTIHHEHPSGVIATCVILGEGRSCRPDGGFLTAEALFDLHGNRRAADVREQPEALWIALERYLIDAIFGPAGGAS